MNTHVIGGQGKTTLLISDLLKALETGGALFVDPYGEATDTILSLFPKREVLIIDPTDIERPVGFNVLYDVRNKPLLASLILSTVKAIWKYDNISTPILDRTLYNSIASLLEYEGANLLHIEPLLTDKSFRERVLKCVSDATLLRKWAYWEREYAKDWRNLVSSTENKAGEFSEDPRIRNMIGQDTTFDLRRLMFDKALIILRLPVGQLGQKTTLFGSLFLAYLLSVAYERKGMFPFQVFIDGVEHFDTPIVRHLLADGPRHNLFVTVSHQYLGQLSPELRSSILGNCKRRNILNVGVEDSEYLERTMPKDNNRPSLHDLEPFQVMEIEGRRIDWNGYVKPLPKGRRFKKIVEKARQRYGRPRVKVERVIATF